MGRNIKIAKELLRIAKSLVAADPIDEVINAAVRDMRDISDVCLNYDNKGIVTFDKQNKEYDLGQYGNARFLLKDVEVKPLDGPLSEQKEIVIDYTISAVQNGKELASSESHISVKIDLDDDLVKVQAGDRNEICDCGDSKTAEKLVKKISAGAVKCKRDIEAIVKQIAKDVDKKAQI